MERSKPVLKRRVSHKLFFKGPNYSDSTPINLPSASDTRPHLRQESAEFRLKSGLRDAETTLFNACPWGLSTKERGKGTGCVERTVPSTSAFRRRGGWGGRVPGAAGDPAAGAPAESLPEGSSYLWDRRARWRGGRVAWGAVRQHTEHPASRDCAPRPPRAAPAAPPGPAPYGAGRAAPGGRGGLREPARAAPPALGSASFPARARLARYWTGNPAGNARPGRARGEGTRMPATHTHRPQAGAGFKGEPAVSRHFRSYHFSPLRPRVIVFWGTTSQSWKWYKLWAVNFVSRMSLKSFKREQFR